MRDTIYRDDIVNLLKQRSIQLRGVYGDLGGAASGAAKLIINFPSAQPEPKEIGYTDCADAMMKMWIDNVLTDGEYSRIMDKLNAH